MTTPSSLNELEVDCGPYARPALKAPKLLHGGLVPSVPDDLPLVLANPRVVPVFFSNSPNPTASVDFLKALAVSKMWDVLGEHGVGAAKIEAPVLLPTPAAADVDTDDIGKWIAERAPQWTRVDPFLP